MQQQNIPPEMIGQLNEEQLYITFTPNFLAESMVSPELTR